MAAFDWEAFNEPEYASWDAANKVISINQINNYGAISGTAGDIKTKEYDAGVSHKEKLFGKGTVSFVGTSFTIEVYRDGESLPFKTLRPSDHSAMATIEVDVNTQCKRIAFEFKAPTGYELEDFIIPDEEITLIG